MANIILTNISTLRTENKFSNYSAGDMGIIKGRYTNEAPVKISSNNAKECIKQMEENVKQGECYEFWYHPPKTENGFAHAVEKYLLRTIYEKNPDTRCTIVAITTKEAEEAFTAFRRTIRRYCKRNGILHPGIEKVTFEGRNFSAVIADIIRLTNKSDKIFLDTTGGFRDMVYLLMAVVRILEYEGIRLEKAVYSIFNRQNPKENRIIDITDTYNMFDLINAANSFTSFGNSDELARFFSDCSSSEIQRVTDVMNRFSDEVALCRTSRLSGLLCELNEMLTGIQDISTDNENEILFKSIISDIIRDKFGIREGKIDYLDIIRWCLDNRMIQQAVTIYVEKMPEFIFKIGLLCYKSELLDTRKFDKRFGEYYNMLYNGFLQQTSGIPLFPYPVANLLFRLRKRKPEVFREICTVRSINDLSIKDQLSEDERRGVLNLIRIKNALFSAPNVRRSAKETEEKKQNTKLKNFSGSDIFESPATTAESFVNGLLKNKTHTKLVQGEFTAYVPKVRSVQDINVIEYLESVLAKNNGMYSVKKNVSNEDIKCVLRQLIYVKRYVRNALNHASEESHLANEYDEYFGDIRYNVSAELSVDEIESVLRDAMTLIRKLTI